MPKKSPNGLSGKPGKLVKHSVLGRKCVEFSAHAMQQMSIRTITERQVLLILEEPTETGLPVRPARKRKRIRRQVGKNRAIDVVYELRPDRVVIVTAISVSFKKRTRRR